MNYSKIYNYNIPKRDLQNNVTSIKAKIFQTLNKQILSKKIENSFIILILIKLYYMFLFN